jgi:hypothetical protein
VQGSLALHEGVLYVGTWEKTAHVRAFDLDGRPLEVAFSFRDEALERSEAAGLAVDPERRLWVADSPANRVRVFNLFGVEVGALASAPAEPVPPPPGSERLPSDVRGGLERPHGLALAGGEALGRGGGQLWLVVGCRGRRRHGLQLFDLESRSWVASLRPEGRPDGFFRDVRGVGCAGERVVACEAGAGRLQVFRRGEFLFAAAPELDRAARFEPTAVAPLPDGRLVVAHGGRGGGVALLGASGELLRVLAGPGRGEGEVLEPSAVAVESGRDERHTRVAALDLDGERVQILTLEGRCYGAFPVGMRAPDGRG